MEWIPYLIIASLAGFINIVAAWSKLDKKCRFLPFFKPLKNLGFWIWLFMQFSTPSCVAWFLFSLSIKPEIDFGIVLNILALGIIFVAILNATTEVGNLSINIKPIYDFFIKIAYKQIASQETIRTALFWTELESEIQQITQNNLTFLKNYFLDDISIDEREKEDYQKRINALSNIQPRSEQIKEIIAILKEVRRKDLPDVLKQFMVQGDFLKKYFPNVASL